MAGHAFQTYQFPSCVPEIHLRQYAWCLCYFLSWQHPHLLRQNGLFARVNKCTFHTDTVKYLGYILSPMGLSMDPTKVQTIQDWPEPCKVKDVQSFLGFANFYCQFIHEYSNIVIPLTRLTRKDLKWNFSAACRDAFEKLKIAFLLAPVLTHWIPNTQMMVETDAYDCAIAAILSITLSDWEIHPMAFHSRTLTTPNLIMTLMIKNSWPSSRLFKNGDITLKVPELRSMLSPTTRIWNTLPRPSY